MQIMYPNQIQMVRFSLKKKKKKTWHNADKETKVNVSMCL